MSPARRVWAGLWQCEVVSEYFAGDRSFWVPVLYAVPIGLMAGGAGLVFTWTVGRATNWLRPDEVDNSFLGGDLWWFPVTVGAG